MQYLKEPLSRHDLERLLKLLEGAPGRLVRRDKFFKELQLQSEDYTTDEAIIELLLEHPRLMERPIAMANSKAIIARPAELVSELL